MSLHLDSKRQHAEVVINRVGHDVTIERPDGSTTENKYNKRSSTDVTYTQVAQEVGRRLYRRDSDQPNEGGVSGGRVDTDNPRIALPFQTAAEEDDRVTFQNDNRTYVLDERIYYDTHAEFRATLVQ